MRKLILLALISIFAFSCVRSDAAADAAKCVQDAAALGIQCTQEAACKTAYEPFSKCTIGKIAALGKTDSLSDMAAVYSDCKKDVTNTKVQEVADKYESCYSASSILGFGLLVLLALLF